MLGQLQRERRSFADGARDGEVSTHRACQVPADRESNSGSLGCPRITRIDTHEWLEDALELVLGNSATGVSNVDQGEITGVGRAQLNRTIVARILDRVRQQVQHDLLELLAIDEHAEVWIDRRVLVVQ